jgi:L-asparaginase
MDAAADPAARPRVHLIATGGTISRRAGGRLTADDLLSSAPDLSRIARAEAEQFANTTSGALTLDQWLQLARRINTLFSTDPALSGIVVSIGTDTLEETAYFLDLTVRSDRPVVLTGAMRPPGSPDADGAANLAAAFRVAASPEARGKGVLVVLNGEIHAARDVMKADTHRLDAFRSPNAGRLGSVRQEHVVFEREPAARHTAATEFDVGHVSSLPRVDVVLVYQGATADVIEAMADQGARGIVIAAAGAGALSGSQIDGVRYAMRKGVIVVTSTRTGSGPVAARPAAGGAPDDGRIDAGDLSPVKARILLMLALTTTSDPAAIQRMFRQY